METYQLADAYIRERLAPEDAALKNTIASISHAGMPQHSVSASQGKFLQVLAAACGARRILEIGTLGGYSTIWLARAMGPGGRVISLEIDPGHAAVARRNIDAAGIGALVELRVGPALESLQHMYDDGPFDLVFIDADKPAYVEYFEAAIHLSRPGTIMVCDNVIREGKVLDTHSQDEKVRGVQRFNDMLAQNYKVTATILQTVGDKEWDGMAIAVVK
jgi:predicted O-methyltransferase YrrM